MESVLTLRLLSYRFIHGMFESGRPSLWNGYFVSKPRVQLWVVKKKSYCALILSSFPRSVLNTGFVDQAPKGQKKWNLFYIITVFIETLLEVQILEYKIWGSYIRPGVVCSILCRDTNNNSQKFKQHKFFVVK